MAWLSSKARRGLRSGTVGLAAAATALSIGSDGADARHHHRVHVSYVHVSHARHSASSGHISGHVHRHAHSEEYSPPGSSIVVDGNSGAVLQAANQDAPRHPASLTKVMTLYLLFERLDSGKMRLDTPLKVSQHAADQDPTKLDLKPGSTISVEDAIKGVVTRSANDAAVTIAENIGGDEDTFAKMMTAKAHALGMTRTTYVNASGLPDDDQNTTARDQATLGRAIQDRFPRYYKYFSTESFVYHGESIRNHNHLLGSIEGVDGIKTGFTRASGFNLLTSVHRDGRFLVAVVMGGHSAFARDAHMRDLIGEHIKEAAVHRTAPMIADSGETPSRLRQSAHGCRGTDSRRAGGGACRCDADRDGRAAGCACARRFGGSGSCAGRRHQRYAPVGGLERSDAAASGADRDLPHRAGADGVDGADAGPGAGAAARSCSGRCSRGNRRAAAGANSTSSIAAGRANSRADAGTGSGTGSGSASGAGRSAAHRGRRRRDAGSGRAGRRTHSRRGRRRRAGCGAGRGSCCGACRCFPAGAA